MTMLETKAIDLDAARGAETAGCWRTALVPRIRHWPGYGLLVAVLAAVAGCDSRFADVFTQTAFAGSRTVIDLTLTNYANALAGLLDLLRG